MIRLGLIALTLLAALQGRAAELLTITETSRAAAEPPAGKQADWIDGDSLLQNDRIVAVVAAGRGDRHANLTVRNVGGCVIDLTLRNAPNDQLSCFYPGGGGHAYRFRAAATLGSDLASSGSFALWLRPAPSPDLQIWLLRRPCQRPKQLALGPTVAFSDRT